MHLCYASPVRITCGQRACSDPDPTIPMNAGIESGHPSEPTPRLSIGVPVYNGERYLGLALDSILAQTFEDFEVVISDNASQDRTSEICQEYMARDSRIRYVRSDKNLGAAANYNRVFQESRGELFKWHPHDDAMHPTNVARAVEVLDADPSVVVAYPNTVFIDEAGHELSRLEEGLDLPFDAPHERLGWLVTHLHRCNAVLGVVRRDVMAKTRLIDTFSGSDFVLLTELAMLGKFREIPDYLFFRRSHPKSSLSKNTDQLDLDQWFDTSATRAARFPWLRLLGEQVRSVHRMPLTLGQRLACYPQVARFVVQRWRVYGGAKKAKLKTWYGKFRKRRGMEGA
ncbi:MAG: glycosyltransferase involved in cell wall biosynthesis [Chlamydiales bacterium]